MKYKKIVTIIMLLKANSFLFFNAQSSNFLSSAQNKSSAPANVIVFMRPFEELERQEQFQTPHIKSLLYKNQFAVADKIINNKFNPSGTPQAIHLLYEGFTDSIDNNGEAIFPRLSQNESIDLIITRKIHPVVIHGNTVEFLLRDTNTEIAYYKLTRLKDDELNVFYWDITEVPIPENKKIPISALIIFAEPEHIYVPTGKFITIEGANLLLPTIYTKQGLEKEYDSLKFLTINRYFSSIRHIIKIAPPQRYATRITF